MCVLGGREFGKSEMLWWSKNNSDGFPWLTSLSKFCGFLGNILFHGLLFFWSEHRSTTPPVLLLRLGVLLPFISPWPVRQSSDGSPSNGRLRMYVRSLMMANLVFHCVCFHSNQLRTADLLKKKKIGRAGFNLRENAKTSSTPQFSSVQISCSVTSKSLRPMGCMQHARLPCPLPSPRVSSNACPSSRWCHPTTSASFVPFSSCLWSFPVSGSFPMSWFFASVAKVLEFHLQHESFQWIFRTDFL